MISGIYEIVSPSGDRYIGSSADIANRWRHHRSELKLGYHRSKTLQLAYRQSGGQVVFRMLLKCDPSMCVFYEQRAITTLRPQYNSAPFAASMLGFKHSDESKTRMSISASKRRASMETRLLMGTQRSAWLKTEDGIAHLKRLATLTHCERNVQCLQCMAIFVARTACARFCRRLCCQRYSRGSSCGRITHVKSTSEY